MWTLYKYDVKSSVKNIDCIMTIMPVFSLSYFSTRFDNYLLSINTRASTQRSGLYAKHTVRNRKRKKIVRFLNFFSVIFCTLFSQYNNILVPIVIVDYVFIVSPESVLRILWLLYRPSYYFDCIELESNSIVRAISGSYGKGSLYLSFV